MAGTGSGTGTGTDSGIDSLEGEATPRPPTGAAAAVLAAGVAAALHVGKLPPAIVALQQAMGVTLVQAGFLLSLMQVAGMTLGVAMGSWADALGARRSMLAGLAILTAASAAGALAQDVSALLLLRAFEGLGFLLVALPAPSLLRGLTAPARIGAAMGLWGAYMPTGTALGLLAGPWALQALGWRGWWLALAAVTCLAALVLWQRVPAPLALSPRPGRGRTREVDSRAARAAPAWRARLVRTLSARGPWLVALAFAAYSGQWLAVIGFLPTIYVQAGIAGALAGVLTAAAAAANIVGNVAGGRLLQRGVAPTPLLAWGYAAMAVGALLAFAGDALGLPALARYAAVIGFSAVGGLVPSTLFALAVRFAPGEHTLSTTMGWMQQWSSAGQFAGPPLVAWVASAQGSWRWTGAVTACACAAGLLVTAAIARHLRRPAAAAR